MVLNSPCFDRFCQSVERRQVKFANAVQIRRDVSAYFEGISEKSALFEDYSNFYQPDRQSFAIEHPIPKLLYKLQNKKDADCP